jgi:hypothetical protein
VGDEENPVAVELVRRLHPDYPDFWESIAVDTRGQHVLDALGLPFRDYDEKEKFFLEVAHEAGLNGWQLDRLIYNSNDAVLAALNEERRL